MILAGYGNPVKFPGSGIRVSVAAFILSLLIWRYSDCMPAIPPKAGILIFQWDSDFKPLLLDKV
jgi:hypothetical protein